MRRDALIGVVALLGLTTSCAENRWGHRCRSDSECEDSNLLCSKASDTNVSGVCRYPGELRCGPNTIIDPDTLECVPDPDVPPEVTCGDGTVEEDGRCVLIEPDAAAPEPDAGVDSGV